LATSFTPGLRVAGNVVIQKERRLPLAGETLVQEGDSVRADQVVARTNLPGKIYPVNVANVLNVTPEEMGEAMLKKEGDRVAKDEVIALSKSFFGFFKTEAKAPIEGTIESISTVTGQVIIQAPPIPVEVKAFVDGRVSKIFPNEGVEVETNGAFIQGILGIGGETLGELRIVVTAPDEVLTKEHITPELKDCVVVGGSLVEIEAYQKAVATGVSAIVVGGFHDSDLKELLGYDLGVAITGSEEVGTTLVLTEGFGQIAMAERTFKLLKSLEGRRASVNGATQIRAGVIRPEIIVVRPGEDVEEEFVNTGELKLGATVRIIRNPWFGRIGKVTALPPELTRIPTGALVRVLEVELDAGEKVMLPRANIEMIMD